MIPPSVPLGNRIVDPCRLPFFSHQGVCMSTIFRRQTVSADVRRVLLLLAPSRRPRLQEPRTRILLSRDEQSKNLERIRKTSRNKLARLERSIEAKDNLAERIKTARETNTKAIVLSRSR